MASYGSSTEKANVMEAKTVNRFDRSGKGEIDEANGIRAVSSALDKKKILRKMDLRLISMLAILYLLSFFDRGNIGNAKIEDLQEDLKLLPDQYNWCLTVFFFTYAAFEVPSNLLLKRLRPSV